MSGTSGSNWSINKFFVDVNNPDQDFNIIALESFVRHLTNLADTDAILEVMPDMINMMLFPKLIACMDDSIPEIVNPTLRCFVLLSKAAPEVCLGTLFEKILDEVYFQESANTPQYLSILREMVANSARYAAERQRAMINGLLPRLDRELKQVKQEELFLFALDILFHLVESLEFLFTDEEKDLAYQVIEAYADTTSLDILNSIASLAKVWVVHTSEEQFEKLMGFLFAMENQNNAVFILGAMVKFRPALYDRYLQNLLVLFINKIREEEAELAQLFESNPEMDLADTQFIPHISEYISSLGAMIHAFPDACREYMDHFMQLQFSYFTYGSNALAAEEPVEADGEEDDNEVEADVALDEVDEEIVTGDETWKIRKTLIEFAVVLMECYPDEFLSNLSYADETTDRMSMIDMLIRDNDIGAQKVALNMVTKVIQIYKDRLPEEIVHRWLATLAREIGTDKQMIFGQLLETISDIGYEIGSLHPGAVMIAIEKLMTKINEGLVPSVLDFLKTVFLTVPQYVELIEPMSYIFKTILEQDKIKTTLPCIDVIAHFYVYAKGLEGCECINALNTMILGISGEGGEKTIHAIATLAVFLVTGSYASTDESLNKILECFPVEACSKVTTGAIALIAASEYAGLLQPFTAGILAVLPEKLMMSDITVQYRALWTLRILLEAEVVGPAECRDMIDLLVEILERSDNKCKLQAVVILGLIPDTATAATSTIINKLCDESAKISDDIAYECAKSLCEYASYASEAVSEQLNVLIKNGSAQMKTNPDQAESIARVIGYVSGNVADYTSELIGRFEEAIVRSEAIDCFDLLCIGELGAYTDLSSHEEMINKVWSLVNSEDRDMFTPAATCIGNLVAGSLELLMPRMIASIDEDTTRCATWLLAIRACCKKLIRTGVALDEGSFSSISACILRHADSKSEASYLVSECLSYCITLNPPYVHSLLELATPGTIGPIVMHAIAMYILSVDVEVGYELIAPVMARVDPHEPRISEYALTALKSILRFPAYVSPLLQFGPIALQCTQRVPEHLEVICYSEMRIETDIGGPLRLNAFECLASFFKTVPDQCPIKDMIHSILAGFSDPKDDVKVHCMNLLSDMSISPAASAEISNCFGDIAVAVKELEEFIVNTEKQSIETPFLKMIAYIAKASEKQHNSDFEFVFSKHKSDDRMKQIQDDLSYALSSTSTVSTRSTRSNTTANYTLMYNYRQDASHIFC